MNIKKIFSIILILIISLAFKVNPVLANCSDCDPKNCEECGCILNSSKNLCIYSNYDDGVKSCGDGYVKGIPQIIPEVVSIAYTVIQIAVPVVLVIMGSLDLFKGITAGKEDDIKKGQQMFIKRLIAAALVFFVFLAVKLVVSLVADGSGSKILECTECFIENNCD